MKKLHNFHEVYDGQAVFRKVLEAMANPGRRVSIAAQAEKLYGENPVFLALAMTLLDNEVGFFVCKNKKLVEDIALLTLSNETSPEEADFIFVETEEQLTQVFKKAKCGTLADPQKSATLIIKVSAVSDVTWNIFGAGVDGTMTLQVPEIAERAMELRKQQEYEYPQGVDMIFITDDGEMFCIPRLVMKMEEG